MRSSRLIVFVCIVLCIVPPHVLGHVIVFAADATASGNLLVGSGSVQVLPTEQQQEVIDTTEQQSLTSVVPIQMSLGPRIRITEILPDPKGDDSQEWIELGNVGDMPGPISGLGLRLSGSKSIFVIPATGSGGAPVMLPPGERLILNRTQTKIQLVNKGGALELFSGSLVIDTFSYGAAFEEVSIGRDEEDENAVRMFCVPTPGRRDVLVPMDPQIILQSGELEGEGSVAVNLEARTTSGSLASAQCTWSATDGWNSEGCNPAPHAVDNVGTTTITLQVQNVCGEQYEQSIQVHVRPIPQIEPTSQMVDVEEEAVMSQTDAEKTVAFPRCQTFSSGVEFSELFPASASGAAWIELKNITGNDIPLCGWVIDTGELGGSLFRLDAYSIRARSFLVVPQWQLGFSFGSSSGNAHLLSPNPLGQALPRIEVDTVAYARAQAGHSYARKIYGEFFWTPFITPHAVNRFPTEALGDFSSLAKLSALPNPKGQDTGSGEWLNIANSGSEDLELNRWVLRVGGSKWAAKVLPDLQIAPGSEQKITFADTGLMLQNSSGAVELLSPNGVIVDRISWLGAQENQVYPFLSVASAPHLFAASGTHVLERKEDDSRFKPVDQVLKLREIFPAPKKGESEWVEIECMSALCDLTGWMLDDIAEGGSAPWKIPAEAVTHTENLFLVSLKSGRAMFNNGGDYVRLLDPTGNEVDTVSYPEMKTNDAYAKDGSSVADAWCITSTPTQLQTNVCSAPAIAKKSVKPKKVSSPKKSTKKKKNVPKFQGSGALLPEQFWPLKDQIAKGDITITTVEPWNHLFLYVIVAAISAASGFTLALRWRSG